jgi:hypothetical protein
MATFVCALCLKDIHGDPIWVNPLIAGARDADADDAGLACLPSNLPDHAPYHAACAARAFPGLTSPSGGQ